MLLTRNKFRNAVFERDDYKCVVCGNMAQDAHHLMERRLWRDGGYYVDNGVSLCPAHHVQAEQTTLTVEELREAAGITNVVLPDHLYRESRYDKWGNIILADGRRMRGELFDDESVQKILAAGNVLDQFTSYVKYPRTYHLPWSPGRTRDDRVLDNTCCFDGKEVVVTEKMDGENTTMYSDYMHARSLDSQNHPSRNWVKNYHAKIGWQIPDGWRLCGENLYAAHSIKYENLDNFFLAFSLWDDTNTCLSWADTCEWCELMGLDMVPELYRGRWDLYDMQRLIPSSDDCEGYVVRLAESFHYSRFKQSVAKYVRVGHVQTSHHWRFERIRQNSLRSNA